MKIKNAPFLALLTVALLCSRPAQADVVVIVSAKSSLAPTLEQVCQVYLGKTKTPVPINLAEKNAIRDEFYSKACHKDPAQVRSIWSKLLFTGTGTSPKEVDNDGDMKKSVSADPSTIGYIDKKNIDGSVKAIATVN